MLSVFGEAEYQARVQHTLKGMEKAEIDAMVAFANKVMPGHVRYLSGYETRHGIHDFSFFVLAPGREPALLTNARWEDQRKMTWVRDIEIVGLDQAGDAIANRLPKSARSIGVAGYNHLPTPVYRRLSGRFSSAGILDASSIVLEVRTIKSPAEIAVLRRCAEITDTGGMAFLAAAREGMSERQVLVEVESALKLNGSDEVSFTTQVGRGPRTASICPYATDELVTNPDLMQLDCGATYFGYCGDLSRVAVIGQPSARQRLLLDVTAEMYDRVVEAVRPGADAAEIATLGVRVAERHGLKDLLYVSPAHQVAFMAHGIGCSYYEPPEIDVQHHTEILENMIVVVEPILAEEGTGGVKIEDAMLVTASGVERFSKCKIRTW